MTEPGQVFPAQPGWWVRTGRVGTASGGYGWQPTTLTRGVASLSVASSITAGGVVGEQLTGVASLSVASSITAGGVVGEQLTGDATLSVTATMTATTPTVVLLGANAGFTTVTIPTHAVGDLIVVAAFATHSNAPTKPSAGGTVPNWVDVEVDNGPGSAAIHVVRAVAIATNHTVGTWYSPTSANMIAAVLRGQNASIPIGGHDTTSGSSGTSATAPGVSLIDDSGRSVLLHFYGCERLSGANWAAVPSGYTRRVANGSNGNPGLCLNTKNVTTSDGSIGQGTIESGRDWIGATVEIVV